MHEPKARLTADRLRTASAYALTARPRADPALPEISVDWVIMTKALPQGDRAICAPRNLIPGAA